MNIVIFGLSLSSSWGNGHATTYRGLIKALSDRGHRISFIEKDVPWFAGNRDLPDPPYCDLYLYQDLKEIPLRFAALVAQADLVILGSYVDRGAAVGEWITRQATGITAFYDIDTPVTLAGLPERRIDYLTTSLIPRFHLYLSFAAGPALTEVAERYGSPCVRPLLCSADMDTHSAQDLPEGWALGYLGTYSTDRQPGLEALLCAPAQALPDERFVVAGPQYPDDVAWPANVERIPHLAPSDHSAFYSRQRFTLNVTRKDMVAIGYSPSVRLFEAAACRVPIISDRWAGIETAFEPDTEILIADGPRDVRAILTEMPAERRRAIAQAAHAKLLRAHTAEVRARQLESYVAEVLKEARRRKGRNVASVA